MMNKKLLFICFLISFGSLNLHAARIPGNYMTDEDLAVAVNNSQHTFSLGEVVGYKAILSYPDGSEEAIYFYAQVTNPQTEDNKVEIQAPTIRIDEQSGEEEAVMMIITAPAEQIMKFPIVEEAIKTEKKEALSSDETQPPQGD